MNVLLVDDEPVMHLIMRKILDKFPGMDVIASFTDTQSAVSYMQERKHDVDLAFVDISMPGGSGLSFASKLDSEGFGTQVVFVTSHKDYAVEAFELSALDYLVKPVTQERMERTIHRALRHKADMQAALSAAPEVQSGGRVSVVTLGDFSVRSEKGRVKWISSKSAELFAYLLLNRGKRISRQRLLSDIFAGMTGSNAEKYLNTTVYQLRKALKQIGIEDAVQSENDGYALDLEAVAVDYEQFENQLDRLGKIHSGNAEQMQQVERLYSGELFGSKAYVWAIHETERLSNRYTAFALEMAEHLLEQGKAADASKLPIKLQIRNPLDETVVGMLMKKHAKAGDKRGLTSQYTDYVRLLNKELGIRPSKELLLLYDALMKDLSGKGK